MQTRKCDANTNTDVGFHYLCKNFVSTGVSHDFVKKSKRYLINGHQAILTKITYFLFTHLWQLKQHKYLKPLSSLMRQHEPFIEGNLTWIKVSLLDSLKINIKYLHLYIKKCSRAF